MKSLFSKYSFDLKKTLAKTLRDPLCLDMRTPEKQFQLKFTNQASCKNFYNKVCTISLVYKDKQALSNLDIQMESAWPFQKAKLY